MKNTLLILRRELGAYLKTPSGYIIAAAILLLDGLLFTSRAVGSSPKLSAEVLQQFFFDAGGTTLIAAVLLSMRLVAEERSSGTLMLLFTSPVREHEIILGKFLSALVFLSVLTIATVYLPALIFINGKVSMGHIVSGYIGMLLMGSAGLGLGILGSTLARNQLIAGVLGGVLVTLFMLAWPLAQIVDPPFKAVIGHLSLYAKHFSPFQRGIVQLSDVVFYVSVTYFTLLGSTRVLQNQRWQ